MSDKAIIVENLSKRYRIGLKEEAHDTLGGAVAAWVKSPVSNFRKLRNLGRFNGNGHADDVIWAVKDVSFEVKQGEVVGLIGRNGAGKSTLLKILSRITDPTSGRVIINGRVSSLLEVGTGFHQELTGRENVCLNGSILGMSRQEIDSKFDEIIAFAEIGKFIDTPVKHYSSGMKVRLAFAVAAHLEPEILLVDEVLAVGDAAFQRKCMGKMGTVAQEGRTVLFVSHNMGAVQALCQRGIILRNGTVWKDDEITSAISEYLSALEEATATDLLDRKDRRGKGQVRLSKVEISVNEDGGGHTLNTGGPARFAFYLNEVAHNATCVFTIYDYLGHAVANFKSSLQGPTDARNAQASSILICKLDEVLLVPGRYRINAAIFSNGHLQDHVEAAAVFDVEHGALRGRPIESGSGYGSVCLPHSWTQAL